MKKWSSLSRQIFRQAFCIILLEALVYSNLVYAEAVNGVPPLPPASAAEQHGQGLRAVTIVFQTALDTKTSYVGQVFLAQTADDVWQGPQLLLPKGSVLRGRVMVVQPPGYFAKGGQLQLTFDHVVLPTGAIKPMQVSWDKASTKIDRGQDVKSFVGKGGLASIQPGDNAILDLTTAWSAQKP